MHQLAHFADSDRYLAVSYDPRSQGLSSQTAYGHYYEQHARDLRTLTEGLGIRRHVLIGWSAGGIEVLEYLRVFGLDDVAGVVVLDIPPRMRGGDKRVEWVDFGTTDLGDQDDSLRSFTFDVHVDRDAFNREFSEWMLDDPSESKIRFFSDISMNTPSLVATQLIMSLWFIDDTAVAERLDDVVPVLYYVRDDWKALAADWVAEHAPHAQIEAHGKHAMFWEHPSVFNAALDRFLAHVESAPVRATGGQSADVFGSNQ